MIPILNSLSDISARYDVLFCDLWGCLHNGQTAYRAAVAALEAFRADGGTVILVTNSPRPRRSVAKQLYSMDAPKSCYDGIASSGDAAQAALGAGLYGEKIYHIGPERDLPFFTNEKGDPYDVERVALEDAESIVCTGLFDDRTETPDDYRATVLTGVNRGLKLLCANPDIMVDVGEKRIYCAGAVAQAYEVAGGESHYYGKPHSPIYQLAWLRAEEIREDSVAENRILCIGDGINTDIQGAVGEGLDSLFITGGLAATDTGTKDGNPDAKKLESFTNAASLTPTAAMGFLR